MILLLWMLAAPAVGRVLLVDDTVRVPAGGWRTVDVALKQRSAVLECRFAVVSGRSGVRVALLEREEAGRFRAGRAHRVIASTGFQEAGGLRHRCETGDYTVLVDNRLEGRGAAEVRLQVSLLFTGEAQAVIVISVAAFAAMVWFAARRLRRAMRGG
jgi:hypothetical protein